MKMIPDSIPDRIVEVKARRFNDSFGRIDIDFGQIFVLGIAHSEIVQRFRI